MKSSITSLEDFIKLLEESLDTPVGISNSETKKDTSEKERQSGGFLDLTSSIRLHFGKPISEQERKLICVLADHLAPHLVSSATEQRSVQDMCQIWLEQTLADRNVPVPAALTHIHWETGAVPMLLKGQPKGTGSEEELTHLFLSYMKEGDSPFEEEDDEAWFFFLKPNMVLLTVPLSFFIDDEIDEEEHELESGIELWAEGLHDLLQSEAGQSFHIAVHEPVHSPSRLADVVHALMDTHMLARRFRWKRNIYSQKDLALLQLLEPMTSDEMAEVIGRLWSPIDQSLLGDEELVSTFQHFFEESLNVSEAARKLYVHRNTLLYRLEKFRQETGYDVRKFDDALIVRLSLLMLQAIQTK